MLYRVLKRIWSLSQQRHFEPGETVEGSGAAWRLLVERGVVEAMPKPKKEKKEEVGDDSNRSNDGK